MDISRHTSSQVIHTRITEEETKLLGDNGLDCLGARTRDLIAGTSHLLDQVRGEAMIEISFNMGPESWLNSG